MVPSVLFVRQDEAADMQLGGEMTLDKSTAESLPLDFPCATCPHEFGDHSHKGSHRCLESGCKCQAFQPKQTNFQRRVLEDEAHGL